MIVLLVLLSIPAVQTKIANIVTKKLNQNYGTDINIERLGLDWKGNLDIRGVYIADHHQDTLIYSDQITTSIQNFKALTQGNLDFGKLYLKNTKLYIKTYRSETTDNLSLFAEKFKPETPSESSEPFKLDAQWLVLDHADVKIIDQNLEQEEVVSFLGLVLDAENFKVHDVDIFGDVNQLSFLYNNQIDVQKLKGDFSYTYEALAIENMELETSESSMKGDLKLVLHQGSFADFADKVRFEVVFDEARLSTNDLQVFYDEFGDNQLIDISGTMTGPLNDFQLRNWLLKNQETEIQGDFIFQNLLSDTESYVISSPNHQITSNYYDLRRLLPGLLGDSLPKEMEQIGTFTLAGSTRIEGDDIATDSQLQTAIGQLILEELSVQNFSDPQQATYSGQLGLVGVDLGKVLGTQMLGRVQGQITVDGQGFDQQSLNTDLIAAVQSLEFNGYTYTQVYLDGTLKSQFLNGKLQINDPNLKMDFDGLVDMSTPLNTYNFYADMYYAELNQLNLFKRDSISIFTGVIAMDMRGTDMDHVVGALRISQSTYQNEVHDYYFDDILVLSTMEDELRTIEVISPDIVTGKLTGNFKLAELPSLFQNSIASIYANYQPQVVTDNQFLNFNFEIQHTIVEIFLPQIRFGENTFVRGSVASDESKFKLNFRSPNITAFGNYLEKVNLQMDNSNPLFNTYLEVDSINMGFYALKQFNLINVTMKDTLHIRTEFDGGKTQMQDKFNLSLYHTINPMGKSVVGFKQSDFTLKDYQWFINENNDSLTRLTFDNNFRNITLDTLVISHQDEYIRAAVQISDSTYKDIRLQFSNVDLGKLTPALDSIEIGGLINGNLNVLQENSQYYPNSDVSISNLTVNDNLLGDLVMLVTGNADLTEYVINTTLTNENLKSLDVQGKIEVKEVNSTIDLGIVLNDFDLSFANPFGAGVISDIRGVMSGSMKVDGYYKSPDINGHLVLNNTGMRIDELNLDFDFKNNTPIRVTKNRFTIPKTFVTDTEFQTVANLEGYFEHTNFSKWGMNLDLTTDRFLVLNTVGDEESLYYGTAFIEGSASMYGPVDELVIKADAKTSAGTSFKIPISDVHSIGEDSFIYFLSPEEKDARLSGVELKKPEIKGLTLEFDLEITRDALVEVVVDLKNNSMLRGRGEGILFIEIATATGRFNMWGDFHVHEAVYDFRYGGLVQKEFFVTRGSNLSWNGRPERATLDIKAVHKTSANPAVLLDNPTSNRKIDVEVAISMSGDLSSPQLDYEFNFPGVSSNVKSELDYKLADRQIRENQALYLVTTGSFSGDTFSSQQGTDALVQRATGMLNEILADDESKFNVTVNYSQGSTTPDGVTSNQVDFGINTQISERIFFDGRVGVPVDDVGDNRVAGNFQIQVLLNDEGSLKWNIFSREAKIQFIGEEQGFEHGTGLSYSVEFNNFRQLWRRFFGKEEEETTVEENPSGLLNILQENNTNEEGE